MQSVSTRPKRIPASLAGMQEVNSKTLQEVQQQLQAHLTAAQRELRAQVALMPAGCLEGSAASFTLCTALCGMGCTRVLT